MFIGIDPSQRHTGVCVLSPDLKIAEAYDIAVPELPVLESGVVIRKAVGELFDKYPDATYTMEKMMPAARNGALLYYVQMLILEELAARTSKRLAHPLPVQLKSFIRDTTGKMPVNKTDIVNSAKSASGYQRRMSSHMADAYFLARLGEMVSKGLYRYTLSKVELPLFSWGVIGGR